MKDVKMMKVEAFYEERGVLKKYNMVKVGDRITGSIMPVKRVGC